MHFEIPHLSIIIPPNIHVTIAGLFVSVYAKLN